MSAVRAAAVTSGAGAGRMRAWRAHAYGGVAELRLESTRVPALREPAQLLVRVRAASLNPLDVAMLGGYGARALGALRALDAGASGGGGGGGELPLVCGRDFAGTVVRAGPAARLRAGARVWGVVPPHAAGAHAQYVLVRDSWVGEAPARLDWVECGGAPFAALTAMAAVRAAGAGVGAGAGAGAGAGGRVLLLGLGGVGQAALQLLAARGALVTVSCAGPLLPLARELGAAAAVEARTADCGQRLAAAGPYAAALDCAGLGGRGAAGAAAAGAARYVTLTSPLLRETDARGLAGGVAAAACELAVQNARSPAPVRWAYFGPAAGALDELRRLAERGRFRVTVERRYPWWQAPAAYERAAAGGARGKLVLDFSEPEPEPEPAPAP